MNGGYTRVRILFAVLGLLGLIAVAYQDNHRNGFHFDDEPNITKRAAVHVSSLDPSGLLNAVTGAYLPRRAVPNLSFAIDWWRGAGDASAFQWTNLLVHAASALAVWLLLFEILRRTAARGTAVWAALIAAAVWAVHPIQVQSVSYIVQRMTSMAALFTVLSLWCYLRARSRGGWAAYRSYAGAGVAFALGAASKETAWVTPYLWILAEYSVCRHGDALIRNRFDYAALSIPALTLIVVTVDLASGAGPLHAFLAPSYELRDFTMEQRLLTQPRVLAAHLGQILWPWPERFALEHDIVVSTGLLEPVATAFAILGVFAWIAAGIALLLRREHRTLGFFILFVPGTLAIESSAVALELVFEHRMYLPSVGLAGMLALGVQTLLRAQAGRRAALLVGALAVLALLVASTRARVVVWRTPTTLATQNVRMAPGSARAWLNLGTAHAEEGRRAEALAAFERAAELKDDYAEAHLNLGALYSESADGYAQASRHLERAIALNPGSIHALIARGTLYRRRGEPARALRDYRRAIGLGSQSAPRQLDLAVAHYQLGLTFADLRRHDDALAAYSRATALDPGLSQAHFNRGSLLFRLRRHRDAVAAFDAALRHGPEDGDAYFMRGLARQRLGELERALADFSAALAIDPDDAAVLLRRAQIHAAMGRDIQARRDLSASCELGERAACRALRAVTRP
jgi:tetratricopeptide (TPR) repeat protein